MNLAEPSACPEEVAFGFDIVSCGGNTVCMHQKYDDSESFPLKWKLCLLTTIGSEVVK